MSAARINRRSIFQAAGALIAGRPLPPAKPRVIVRRPPLIRQEELRKIIEFQNAAECLAYDVCSRIWAGADFECGSFGVSNLGLLTPEGWREQGIKTRHMMYAGIDVGPAENFDHQLTKVLSKYPDRENFVLR